MDGVISWPYQHLLAVMNVYSTCWMRHSDALQSIPAAIVKGALRHLPDAGGCIIVFSVEVFQPFMQPRLDGFQLVGKIKCLAAQVGVTAPFMCFPGRGAAKGYDVIMLLKAAGEAILCEQRCPECGYVRTE